MINVKKNAESSEDVLLKAGALIKQAS